jgi:hypothetical protein
MAPTNGVATLLVASAAIFGLIAPASGGPAWAGVARPQAALPAGGQQLAELKGSDTAAGDNFGESVAVSGNTIVVGAPGHASKAGRAYVFTRTSSGWQQTAELKDFEPVAGDNFGASVAVSGNIIGVGEPGHNGLVYVFTKAATGWQEAGAVHPLNTLNTAANDIFGVSVAASGTTIAAGDPANDYAEVVRPTATSWRNQSVCVLQGSDTGVDDYFGESVALAGSTSVVGESGRSSAYVFTKAATACSRATEAELGASDHAAGNDDFGVSVAVSGATIAVGDDGHASGGRTYVFTKAATAWHQAAMLKGSDTVTNDHFGASVAVSGSTIVVGASGHGFNAGGAYVFTKAATGWHQAAKLARSDAATGDYFGESVAVSGNIIVVGAPGPVRSKAGRAYVFEA